MSHFFTVVIVPGTTPQDRIEEMCDRLLAPYDENLCVAPYKAHLDSEDVERMAHYYQRSPQDLAGLALLMDDWAGSPGGIDERGLYRWSTANPQGKWDWWTIGGRWYGAVRAAPGAEPDGDERGHFRQVHDNMLPTKLLDHVLSCFALVTPDGVWHEQGKMGWWAIVTDAKDECEWEKEIVKIIQQHQDDILVGIDCHV